MSQDMGSGAAPGREPGRIQSALIRMFMREAKVCERQRLSEHFFSLRLEGAALRNVAWAPGQKIQISFGSAFATRTYTPTEWDSSNGRTHILAYAHGDGPGSDWTRTANVGDRCHLFGPRSSLDVARIPGGALLFGDETSFGLAMALGAHHPGQPPECIFEAHDAAEAVSVLAGIGLPGATVVGRDGEERHLQEVIRALDAHGRHQVAILTGKATSIQVIRRHIKERAGPARSIMSRAYWAPGKRGLD